MSYCFCFYVNLLLTVSLQDCKKALYSVRLFYCLCSNCSLAFAIASDNFSSNNSFGGIFVKY